MENRCYNCAKAFTADRTCFSNGNCEWFEPCEKEDEDVFNLNELLTVRFMRSEKTGRYYLNFIDHTGTTCNNGGYWTNQPTDERLLKWMLRKCYPEWDGKTAPFMYDTELDGHCLLCFREDCERSFPATMSRYKE